MANALPLTYTDLVCFDDVDPLASETSSDMQNLAQDVYHIILEGLGTNIDDPTRGVGVQNYLSGTQAQFSAVTSIIEAQLREDPRIDGVQCTLTDNGNNTFNIDTQIAVAQSIIGVQVLWSNAAGPILSGVSGV